MTTLSMAEIIRAWSDPRTWGPPGLGCRLCHDNRPYRAKICLACLIRCLGWPAERVQVWVQQDAAYERQQERKEALRLWDTWPFIPTGIIAYAEKYGVWLVEERILALREVSR